MVSCSKLKLDRGAPARDLYVSPLFRGSRRYVELACDEWGILSARHGLVLPDQVIEPYDVSLSGYSRETRLTPEQYREWLLRTFDQVAARWGRHVLYIVLAGRGYARALEGFPHVELPLKGLALGPRLAWLRDRLRELEANHA